MSLFRAPRAFHRGVRHERQSPSSSPRPRTSTRPRSSRCPIRARSTSRARAPDIRVPMREITQSRHAGIVRRARRIRRSTSTTLGPVHRPGGEDRHPLGPAGAARSAGSRSAATPKLLAGPTSRYGSERLADPEARRAALQPEAQAAPREGRAQRDADALRAPRHRHAGDGVHRDPREPERAYSRAASRGCPRSAAPSSTAARASAPRSRTSITPEFVRDEVARGRAIIPANINHPETRADDHRPQLPGEDQRQHRQLGACPRRSARKSRR